MAVLILYKLFKVHNMLAIHTKYIVVIITHTVKRDGSFKTYPQFHLFLGDYL